MNELIIKVLMTSGLLTSLIVGFISFTHDIRVSDKVKSMVVIALLSSVSVFFIAVFTLIWIK